MNDFLKTSSIMKIAGIGLSQGESYNISLKVAEISQKQGLTNCRFWGKVLGTSADYYIYEGTLSGVGLGLDGLEARGTGSNKATYWAQSDPLGALTQLPDVSAAEIKAARGLKKYFSGNLYKTVAAGLLEMNLLRAQIARITASCKLHVGGYFQPSEENPTELVVDAEFAFPGVADIAAQGSWVHTADYLLTNGRTAYPENPDELGLSEEGRAALDADMEACPAIPLLAPIAGDPEADDDGNSKAWTIKQMGDKSTYAFNEATKQYTVTLVQSNRWPGHFTLSQGSNVHNVYIGYGNKVSSVSGGAPEPVMLPWEGATEMRLPPIMTETALPEEMPEPNPEEVVLEEAVEEAAVEEQ